MSSEDLIKIKALRKAKKSNKYIIDTTYEADETYYLDEDVIIKYGIFKDKEFTEKEFKKILKDINIQNLFNKALNYLSYAPRSKHEVYAYLDTKNEDKNFTQNDLMNIVKRLRELGYVDDTKYANSILEYYKSSKGKNYIVNKLKEKMVDKDIIEEVVENYKADEEEEVAFKITSKIYLQYRKYPISKQRILITQKLIRDGFSVASASKALEKIELVDESVDNLKKDYLKLLKKYDKNDKTCKQKIIASLYRKGYNYSSIIKLVGESDE